MGSDRLVGVSCFISLLEAATNFGASYKYSKLDTVPTKILVLKILLKFPFKPKSGR